MQLLRKLYNLCMGWPVDFYWMICLLGTTVALMLAGII